MKTMNTIQPRIYVGTYAKYNAGSIAGDWLTLSDYSDRDAFLGACRELHKDESDPELMFQDMEGFPEVWYSEISAPDDILWEWLELGDAERAAFGVYADHMGGDVAIEGFRDTYQGVWKSGAAFAEYIAEECGAIPKDWPTWLCVDWEASWHCNLQHDYFTETDDDGNLHFFRNA